MVSSGTAQSKTENETVVKAWFRVRSQTWDDGFRPRMSLRNSDIWRGRTTRRLLVAPTGRRRRCTLTELSSGFSLHCGRVLQCVLRPPQCRVCAVARGDSQSQTLCPWVRRAEVEGGGGRPDRGGTAQRCFYRSQTVKSRSGFLPRLLISYVLKP